MLTLRMRVVIGTTQHDDVFRVPVSLRAMLLPERPALARIDAFAEHVATYEDARRARGRGSATIGVVAWTVEGPRGRETGRHLLASDGGPLETQIRAGLTPAVAFFAA